MNLGGTEKALLSFINELIDQNSRVTLLLLEDGGVLRNEIPPTVTVEILNIFESIKPVIYNPPLTLAKTQINNGQIWNALNTILRYVKVKITKSWYYNYRSALKDYKSEYRADIAVAFAGPSDFISYFVLNHIEAEKKIQWIHFDVSKVLLNVNFGKRYYSLFDTICCVSDNAKKEFDKMFPYVAHKSVVFENIVSSAQTLKMAENGATFEDQFNGLRIVTLGRLSEEKGQQMIPGVVKKLKSQNIKFKWYLIGDGKLRNQLEDAIKKDSMQDHLVLLGSKLNPYAYVKDCDIYVQTSLHEGYCITLKEAQIFKRPILTTNFLSASNLINHSVNGLIVEINEEAIYNGVKLLLENKELRDRFSYAVVRESGNEKMLHLFK